MLHWAISLTIGMALILMGLSWMFILSVDYWLERRQISPPIGEIVMAALWGLLTILIGLAILALGR